MKKNTVITALVGILAMAVTPAFVQEENGFKKSYGLYSQRNALLYRGLDGDRV